MSHPAGRCVADVLDAAPDAMLCADRAGRLVLVNSCAEELFGYRREELVGRPVDLLVPEAAPAAHRELSAGYQSQLRKPPTGTVSGAGRRRDGSTFPAEVSLSAMNTGEGLLVVAAVRDVGERLAARGVAHEFNNLLSVISSYAAFVAEDIARDLPGEAGESILADIAQVQHAADRAAGLTEQLLALARPAEHAPANAYRLPGSLERGGALVLVVEDEPAVREVTRRILERNGYRVMAAADGPEALGVAAACDQRIDALVTDVLMPGMQGREVAERLRALQPGIRVLFVSGDAKGLLGAEGRQEPGVNLLEKPFTEASLLESVRGLLAAPGTA
jgi:PAS domain S-box-containing protein